MRSDVVSSPYSVGSAWSGGGCVRVATPTAGMCHSPLKVFQTGMQPLSHKRLPNLLQYKIYWMVIYVIPIDPIVMLGCRQWPTYVGVMSQGTTHLNEIMHIWNTIEKACKHLVFPLPQSIPFSNVFRSLLKYEVRTVAVHVWLCHWWCTCGPPKSPCPAPAW